MTIYEFQDNYRFLSNFWYVNPPSIMLDTITYLNINDGYKYKTVEHAYQAAKSDAIEDRYALSHRIDLPGDAKKYGRAINMRKEWESIKVDVMYQLLIQKFRNRQLRALLLQTGDQVLQEGNRWNDTFWGIDLRTGKGSNHLGQLLMKVRSELLTKP